MNQCDNRIKDLLPLYYDQELTSNEKALVDNHIATCEECSEELELYQLMAEEFSIDIEAPASFHKDLVQKLNSLKTVKKPSFYQRYNKYINVAAMLVLVLFLSVIGLTQGNKWSNSSDFNETSMMTESNQEATSEARMKTSDATEEASDEVMTEEFKTEMLTVEETEETKATEETGSQEVAVTSEDIGTDGGTTTDTTDENSNEVATVEEAPQAAAIKEDSIEDQIVDYDDDETSSADVNIESGIDESPTVEYGNSMLADDSESDITEKNALTSNHALETDLEQEDTMLSGDGLNNITFTLIIIVTIICIVVLVIILIFIIRKNKINK